MKAWSKCILPLVAIAWPMLTGDFNSLPVSAAAGDSSSYTYSIGALQQL